MTLAEQRLWSGLRDRQIAGFSFCRRHAVHRFTVDFFSPEAGLVIEVDGPVPDERLDEDFAQQKFLEGAGLRVIRFTHGQVCEDLEWVLGAIHLALHVPARPPVPPHESVTHPIEAPA